MKADEAGYRKDIADADWIRHLKAAARNGSIKELRGLEKTLSSAIKRLEDHLSGEHARREQESMKYWAEQETRPRMGTPMYRRR